MAQRKRSATRPEPEWPDPVPVKEWMTTPVATIRAGAPVREAVELMKARQIRHLPVVDDGGRLAGIVTDRDLRQMVFDPAIQERLGEVVEASALGELYEYGFPEPSWGEPWQNEAPGL